MSKPEYEQLIDRAIADLTGLKTYLSELSASDAAKVSAVKGFLLNMGGYSHGQDEEPTRIHYQHIPGMSKRY